MTVETVLERYKDGQKLFSRADVEWIISQLARLQVANNVAYSAVQKATGAILTANSISDLPDWYTDAVEKPALEALGDATRVLKEVSAIGNTLFYTVDCAECGQPVFSLRNPTSCSVCGGNDET